MTEKYRVVITGKTVTGVPLAWLREAVAQAFKVEGAPLERMLSGRPLVVLRSGPLEAAEKLHARLQTIGLEARVVSASEVAIKTSPSAAPVRVPLPEISVNAEADELFSLGAPGSAASLVQASVEAASPPLAPPRPEAAPAPALELAMAEDITCPKCGEVQPKRNLCRKCGLDMPRYRAAQEAAERDAFEEREARLAEHREARASGRSGGSGQRAGILGIGFGGRLGRFDYLAGSLLSSVLWLLFVMLAVKAGKPGVAGLGVFLVSIYGLRCIALRLHDTGRSGWLALVILVPLLGALMALALLFMRGEDDDNDYGQTPPDGGGRRALAVLLSFFVVSWMFYRDISRRPERAMQYVEAMTFGQGKKALAADDEAEEGSPAGARQQVRYAKSNEIDIYVMAGCGACDQMQSWLKAKGLPYTVHAVDRDPQAAERLRTMTAGDGQGRIMLPALKINGKLLPGNPDLDQVHKHLRQE